MFKSKINAEIYCSTNIKKACYLKFIIVNKWLEFDFKYYFDNIKLNNE